MNLYFLVEGQRTEKKFIQLGFLIYYQNSNELTTTIKLINTTTTYSALKVIPAIIHKHLPNAVEDIVAKNINYSKNNPGDVVKSHYLNQIVQRITDDPTHLQSFQVFIEFCRNIKSSFLESV